MPIMAQTREGEKLMPEEEKATVPDEDKMKSEWVRGDEVEASEIADAVPMEEDDDMLNELPDEIKALLGGAQEEVQYHLPEKRFGMFASLTPAMASTFESDEFPHYDERTGFFSVKDRSGNRVWVPRENVYYIVDNERMLKAIEEERVDPVTIKIYETTEECRAAIAARKRMD